MEGMVEVTFVFAAQVSEETAAEVEEGITAPRAFKILAEAEPAVELVAATSAEAWV